jgi:hypothetical protein
MYISGALSVNSKRRSLLFFTGRIFILLPMVFDRPTTTKIRDTIVPRDVRTSDMVLPHEVFVLFAGCADGPARGDRDPAVADDEIKRDTNSDERLTVLFWQCGHLCHALVGTLVGIARSVPGDILHDILLNNILPTILDNN